MTEVTGRDRHVITRALAIAIKAIDAAPPRRRPSSDQSDMKRLLETMIESDAELAVVMRSALFVVEGE